MKVHRAATKTVKPLKHTGSTPAPKRGKKSEDTFSAAPPAQKLVAPPAAPAHQPSTRVQPAWMGNTAVRISRDSSGRPDPSDSFTFDTWVRQRAAITRFEFEVWAPGTTDRNNPDLWRDLDVEIHYRYGGTGPFQKDYVSIDGRSGNNARYGVDLRKLDPWSGPEGDRAEPKPGVPLGGGETPDGQILPYEAKLEFFFTVNGKELRRADGQPFEGRFTSY